MLKPFLRSNSKLKPYNLDMLSMFLFQRSGVTPCVSHNHKKCFRKQLMKSFRSYFFYFACLSDQDFFPKFV